MRFRERRKSRAACDEADGNVDLFSRDAVMFRVLSIPSMCSTVPYVPYLQVMVTWSFFYAVYGTSV